DEMPVQAGQIQGLEASRRKVASPRQDEHRRNEDHADRQVERVQAGHDEVEQKEELGVFRVHAGVGKSESRRQVMLEVLDVLGGFDSKEDEPENSRDRE